MPTIYGIYRLRYLKLVLPSVTHYSLLHALSLKSVTYRRLCRRTCTPTLWLIYWSSLFEFCLNRLVAHRSSHSTLPMKPGTLVVLFYPTVWLVTAGVLSVQCVYRWEPTLLIVVRSKQLQSTCSSGRRPQKAGRRRRSLVAGRNRRTRWNQRSSDA